MQVFYVDEILQAFKSDNNFQFILGACSGTVDQSGNDIKDAVAKVIVPCLQIERLITSLREACDVLGTDCAYTSAKPSDLHKVSDKNSDEEDVREGTPITFRIS